MKKLFFRVTKGRTQEISEKDYNDSKKVGVIVFGDFIKNAFEASYLIEDIQEQVRPLILTKVDLKKERYVFDIPYAVEETITDYIDEIGEDEELMEMCFYIEASVISKSPLDEYFEKKKKSRLKFTNKIIKEGDIYDK